MSKKHSLRTFGIITTALSGSLLATSAASLAIGIIAIIKGNR
ncbi:MULTISPECIES: hypothetical protein [Lacticaseibacillus]|uniref:Uncharacterized protein n=2 Tax=Lacticaseibacillus TaxID=2759736 RepID=A0ABW4CJ98_9LACO|nr:MULTISPECIES: hypothetical protein [Lacticaseibacillus]